MSQFSSGKTGRRTVLLAGGLGSAALAGGLSACGGGSSTPSPSAASGGPVTVTADQVPVGGGTVLPDAPYVVTQPEAGRYLAFSKICTHQGCPVSRVDGTNIVCLCHGSTFSITDGAVTKGPATEGLPTVPVTASGDQLTVG